MVDTGPLAILEERDAIVLQYQPDHIIISLTIANQQTDLPITIALLTDQPQDIRRCRLDFQPAVRSFHDSETGRFCRRSRPQLEQMLFQLQQHGPVAAAMIVRQQGNGIPGSLRRSLLQLMHQPADFLHRPIGPVKDSRFLLILRQPQVHGLSRQGRPGHRQRDMDPRCGLQQGCQHTQLLWVEEHEAIKPDLCPLHQFS